MDAKENSMTVAAKARRLRSTGNKIVRAANRNPELRRAAKAGAVGLGAYITARAVWGGVKLVGATALVVVAGAALISLMPQSVRDDLLDSMDDLAGTAIGAANRLTYEVRSLAA
jgi:hypothetical protein